MVRNWTFTILSLVYFGIFLKPYNLHQGFPKWVKSPPWGPWQILRGPRATRGKKGALSSKRATERAWDHNLKLTLDILALHMKSEKEGLKCFYGSLWVILLKRAIAFLISLKGAICKRAWETLTFKVQTI